MGIFCKIIKLLFYPLGLCLALYTLFIGCFYYSIVFIIKEGKLSSSKKEEYNYNFRIIKSLISYPINIFRK